MFRKRKNTKRASAFDVVEFGDLQAAFWLKHDDEGAPYFRWSIRRMVGIGKQKKYYSSSFAEQVIQIAELSRKMATWYLKRNAVLDPEVAEVLAGYVILLNELLEMGPRQFRDKARNQDKLARKRCLSAVPAAKQ